MASLLSNSWRNCSFLQTTIGLACKCFVLIKQLYLVKHNFAVKMLQPKLWFLHIVSHLIWWLKICSTLNRKIFIPASVVGGHPVTLTIQGGATTRLEKWKLSDVLQICWNSTHKMRFFLLIYLYYSIEILCVRLNVLFSDHMVQSRWILLAMVNFSPFSMVLRPELCTWGL